MPYKVIVVDDSAFMRKIISDLIEKDSSFQVIDTANNGREAIEKISMFRPDVVTMDVEMPEMNGLEALKVIMAANPLPVIMLSGINEEGMKETIMALESGAFDFIRKPSVRHAQHIDQVGKTLLEQLHAAMQARERRLARLEEESKRKESKGASQVLRKSPSPPANLGNKEIAAAKQADNEAKLISRPQARKMPAVQAPLPHSEPAKPKQNSRLASKSVKQPVLKEPQSTAISQIVAIGCSTGGPRALKTLLENIPAKMAAPLIIVQHMPPNFTKSLAQRLNTFSPLEVVEAEHGMRLAPGWAYIAPGGHQLTIVSGPNGTYEICLSDEDPVNGHKPSVDVMFESLLPLTSLQRHLVLMTGMGSDGARMMKRLYDAGVTSTFAESEETCVVYGMPRSAVEMNCVSHILPLQEIAQRLVQAVM